MFNEPHAPNQKDYTDVVSRAAATNPDIMAQLPSQYVGDSVTFVRNMDAIKFKPKIYVTNNPGTPGFISALGPLAEGVMGTAFWNPDMTTPGNKDFAALYKTLNKRDATFGSALASSCMQVFEAGVAAAGSIDPAKVTAAISNLHDASTVCGVFNIANTVPVPQIVVQVTGGQLNTIFPFEFATAKARLTNP